MTINKEELWQKYYRTKSIEDRNKIIEAYVPLIKVVAGRLTMYMGDYVRAEDMESYGCFGLIDAVSRFNPDIGVKFETYASTRIRGAIIDEIRKTDWVSRTVRNNKKRLQEAEIDLTSKLNRIPTQDELAEYLGVDDKEYSKMVYDVNCCNLIYSDQYNTNEEQYSHLIGKSPLENTKQTLFDVPEQRIVKNETWTEIAKALETLTDKERTVITLYYYEWLTLKEISKVLEVSESRVSQLHSRALDKLKIILQNDIEIFYATV